MCAIKVPFPVFFHNVCDRHCAESPVPAVKENSMTKQMDIRLTDRIKHDS